MTVPFGYEQSVRSSMGPALLQPDQQGRRFLPTWIKATTPAPSRKKVSKQFVHDTGINPTCSGYTVPYFSCSNVYFFEFFFPILFSFMDFAKI